MKLLIFSDSHGNVDNMIRAVKQTHPDMILHLGDVMRDGEKLHELFSDIPFEQVPGNCDYNIFDPPEKMLLIEGKRILMCHGHTLRVKETLLTAMYAALERNADIFLFGHTHRVFCETRNGVSMLNPGSIGNYAYPTYGIADISEDGVHINTFPLNGYPHK